MNKDENEIEQEIMEILKSLENIHYPGNLHTKKSKMQAEISLKHNELEGIYYLVESHSPNLRFTAIHQFEKSLQSLETTLPINKSYIDFTCTTTSLTERIHSMLSEIEEMPKEWTIIQLTSSFNAKENIDTTCENYHTDGVHVTVFNCGSKEDPFTVTVYPPRDKISGEIIEIKQEMFSIIKDNLQSLQNFQSFLGKTFKSSAEKLVYSEVRFFLNNRLEKLVKEIQEKWLREWSCMLIGKFLNDEVEDIIQAKVNAFNLTTKNKNILKCLIKGSGFLSLTDIKNGLLHIFPEECEKSLRISLGKDIQQMCNTYKFAKQLRHPVLLIVDEKLDIFPWEALEVLENHPASRMPSLHFTYALFKEYESTIVKGNVTNISSKNGTYLINPGLDLKNMENRLKNFVNYWMPDWNGMVGITPSEEDFKNLLNNGDIFIYSGHGNGTQFFASEKIQKMKIKKVILLFGCSSATLTMLGPQVEMFGSYQMYLVACSPCVVGTLWAVTDIDTDLVTTEFLSQWIPSDSSTHWSLIDKKKWETGGNFAANSTRKSLNETDKHEPELLRALCRAKKVAKQFLMRAAYVARGLPVKIN
ncbi:hypothetical protein FQA39_LY09548 [Lamprigera yunnana]|nr:hypothetical protein FQA39_LY09548 [Lamprigera yunnana]